MSASSQTNAANISQNGNSWSVSKKRMSKKERRDINRTKCDEKKEMLLFRSKISGLVQKYKNEEIRAQVFLAKIYELVQKYAQPYNFCVVCAKDKPCTQPVGFSVCKECRQKHSDNSKEQPKGYLNFPKLIQEGFEERSYYDRSLKLIKCIDMTDDRRLEACMEFPKCNYRSGSYCQRCKVFMKKIKRSENRL